MYQAVFFSAEQPQTNSANSSLFNKIFDSVSLRYLFDDGEENDCAPVSDVKR